MGDVVKWGIYSGFPVDKSQFENWEDPKCPSCSLQLLPWIDWKTDGSVGYCSHCRELQLVRSETSPGYQKHSRCDLLILEGHIVRPLPIPGFPIAAHELWAFHETLPVLYEWMLKLMQVKEKLPDSGTGHVVEHLIWSLVFNGECLTTRWTSDYIRFVFRHPHGFETGDGFKLWVGHEYDAAKHMLRTHPLTAVRTIFDLWLENKDEMDPGELHRRIRWYLPQDEALISRFGEGFAAFARMATEEGETNEEEANFHEGPEDVEEEESIEVRDFLHLKMLVESVGVGVAWRVTSESGPDWIGSWREVGFYQQGKRFAENEFILELKDRMIRLAKIPK